MVKNQAAPGLPPGTEAMFSVTCKDVVLGRGSGTQNHCGNVTYRKLVYLNKELYATSSKFDKLKISKAIVAAVREFGGNFMQADEKRGGLYYDIGDKRAWDKTSQALREGQGEIRARLAEEDPSGMSKVAEYHQVISEQTFFAYACKMLESLYHPVSGDSGITACGNFCPHAKRRLTLNELGADAMAIHEAMQAQSMQLQGMQSIMPPSLPPPQIEQAYTQTYDTGNINSITPTSSMNPSLQQYQGNLDPIQPLPALEPLPFNQDLFFNGVATESASPRGNIVNEVATHAPASRGDIVGGLVTNAPASAGDIDTFEPLPYHAPDPPNMNTTSVGSIPAEQNTPAYTSYTHVASNMNNTPGGSMPTEQNAPTYTSYANMKTTPRGFIATDQTAPTYSYSNSLAKAEISVPPQQNIRTSIEPVSYPLPYQNEGNAVDKPDSINDRSSSTFGSVFSLRKFCSEDVEITSEEGKLLMQQLSSEVDGQIRRKSYGLIQIDTTQAFEDLVFEDDSMGFDEPTSAQTTAPTKRENRRSSSSSSLSMGSSSRNSGRSASKNSGFSYKDDMSLMNMSILTLDERGESETSSSLVEDSPKEEGRPLRSSILKQPYACSQKTIKDKGTRVSFAGTQMSLMSMDDRSFSKLIDSVGDPDADQRKGFERRGSASCNDSQTVSRKLGFPMRQTVAQKYEEKYGAEGPPTEVTPKSENNDRISTLTIADDTAPSSLRHSEFTVLAGEVENPPEGMKHSLRPSNMSISNMSGFESINMSLGEFDLS
mmetsp:Transcript_11171/g.23766  ORF Transcript_11171/g.23766 Transcript_11171/m.23766 type:complete len:770 (-) Transcript_11171:316-2625(-)